MKSRYILFLPILTLLSCKGTVAGYFYDHANEYSVYENVVTFKDEEQEIDTLRIDWIAGHINIVEGEEFSIKEENNPGHNYFPLYYRFKDDALDIRYCKSGAIATNTDKDLQLSIPSYIKNLSIKVVSANYTVVTPNNKISHLNIDAVSGNGDIKINSLKTMDVDSVSGNLVLDSINSLELENVKIDTVSGNYDLYLDAKKGYKLSFGTISGTLNQDFEDGEDDTLETFNIDFDSVSGNLNIYKRG